MKTNKVLLYGLAAGFLNFILGWLFYGILLYDFIKLPPELATVLQKDPMLISATLVSCLVWGLLLTLVLGHWAKVGSWQKGAIMGAIFGFLLALAMDLSMFSMYTFITIRYAVVDVIANTVIMGIMGGFLGWLLSRDAKN